jgi:hypothetical protein
MSSTCLTELNEWFDAVYSEPIELPTPSEIMPERFSIFKKEQSNESLFKYLVRKSFRILVDKVLSLFTGERITTPVLRYIGNVGAGKSHNLAALVDYLRVLKRISGSQFKLSIVYVSSCSLLFEDPIENLQLVLSETFPKDSTKITSCEDWKKLVQYVKEKSKWSIIFIFDNWNYVNPEMKLIPAEQSRRLEYQEMLGALSSKQYRIEAISAGSESLTSGSTAISKPPNTAFLNLYGGLNATEWSAWKGTSSLFHGMSAEDDAMVTDFTGLVPLYLRQLEDISDGDLSSRICRVERVSGSFITNSLRESSKLFQNDEIDREQFSYHR